MKTTLSSEISNHGDLLVFPPFAYPFMYIFSSFSANTLLVHKFNFLHFLIRVPEVIVSFSSCTVLQLFALVLCFGDQVLSPGSSLATDFFGVVPLWRVAQEKFFQPWSYVTFSENHQNAQGNLKMDRHASVQQLQFCPSVADSWCGWQPVQAGSHKEYVRHNIMPEAVLEGSSQPTSA